MNIQVKVNELLEMLQKGQIREAQEKFFDANVVTREANGPAAIGKANALDALATFQKTANVTGFRGYKVGSIAVNGNVSFYDAVLQLEVNGGTPVDIEQTVVTEWNNGLNPIQNIPCLSIDGEIPRPASRTILRLL